MVLHQLKGKAAFVLGVVAVGNAHRHPGFFCPGHHKAAEFVHVGMHDGVFRVLAQHPVQLSGVNKGTFLGDEGDAVDPAAQSLDLFLIHTGKGADKIELEPFPVNAAVKAHHKALVSTVRKPGHAVHYPHRFHKNAPFLIQIN